MKVSNLMNVLCGQKPRRLQVTTIVGASVLIAAAFPISVAAQGSVTRLDGRNVSIVYDYKNDTFYHVKGPMPAQPALWHEFESARIGRSEVFKRTERRFLADPGTSVRLLVFDLNKEIGKVTVGGRTVVDVDNSGLAALQRIMDGIVGGSFRAESITAFQNAKSFTGANLGDLLTYLEKKVKAMAVAQEGMAGVLKVLNSHSSYTPPTQGQMETFGVHQTNFGREYEIVFGKMNKTDYETDGRKWNADFEGKSLETSLLSSLNVLAGDPNTEVLSRYVRNDVEPLLNSVRPKSAFSALVVNFDKFKDGRAFAEYFVIKAADDVITAGKLFAIDLKVEPTAAGAISPSVQRSLMVDVRHGGEFVASLIPLAFAERIERRFFLNGTTPSQEIVDDSFQANAGIGFTYFLPRKPIGLTVGLAHPWEGFEKIAINTVSIFAGLTLSSGPYAGFIGVAQTRNKELASTDPVKNVNQIVTRWARDYSFIAGFSIRHNFLNFKAK